ncbi:ERBB receptor feedback inhibitor 1 [Hemicordylus capensis]|uniref:ERBB receptor feedback inhibitor 1 n=1 Tax=Hemicordylus capensis TaxID=884348 RepID=UPI002303D87F|nr:ERBB receptor feedback inhibitor 1 [Hemicordylus capensis]XP_053137396.1 ERBB receptor feedback inhibitor 1 [Hemicordylus capensis]XP_053137397.1 ERBB receptor feedback inhibitor 1 [Hemicordylus capensis]
MSTAGLAAPGRSVPPLKSRFLHGGQSVRALKACWSGPAGLGNSFFSVEPVSVACDGMNSPAQQPWAPADLRPASEQHGSQARPRKGGSPPRSPGSERPGPGDPPTLPGFGRLSVSTGCVPDEAPPHAPGKSGPLLTPPAPSTERSARPLPPLPIAEDSLHDEEEEEDREVEFLTSSDTDFLLEGGGAAGVKPSAPDRRSFRDCGQINYAYLEAPVAGPEAGEPCSAAAPVAGCAASTCPPPPPPQQLHRRLRRSHSGPAGSFNKPVVRIASHFHRASPSSDDDKPEVPPRAPIPPRALKPDYRRWSAEVASHTYSDEDKPPKVPPREPLSPRSNSRTPSPKSLPLYLNGIMPPTQSFAPDPNYVSSKALQRQHSEGSAHKVPCILPIIENGKKVSSTHYYLLPERPPYLDKYEKFFREAEESTASADGHLWGREAAAAATTRLDLQGPVAVEGPVKSRHWPCMVSP